MMRLRDGSPAAYICPVSTKCWLHASLVSSKVKAKGFALEATWDFSWDAVIFRADHDRATQSDAGATEMGRQVLIVTACGAKKKPATHPAGQLYESPRIKALGRRCVQGGWPFAIVSAKYGLVMSDTPIELYDQEMTAERIPVLLPQVSAALEPYSAVVYFQAGARRLYRELLDAACLEVGIPFCAFGTGFMGGINDLERMIERAMTTYDR